MRNLVFYISALLFCKISVISCYKILSIFPHNARSHHIFFSSLVEELATRGHDVTVVNYFPLKKLVNLRQISLRSNNERSSVNIEQRTLQCESKWFSDLCKAYYTVLAYKHIANYNCNKLVANEELREIISSKVKYDLVIAEQFVTDCGLAIAHQLEAPVIGIAAHVLLPWTYSRLGSLNHPVYVPNHFIGTGSKPNLWNKIKSAAINFIVNFYYYYVIQNNDYEIVKKIYPLTPDLEILGKAMSMILLNQYFPLTGSQLYGANVIEIGGMHIQNETDLIDKELRDFLNRSVNGVVYISFGSIAANISLEIMDDIIETIENIDMNFVWKIDDINRLRKPSNLFYGKWLPQQTILCHSKVLVFVTHSGMLSSTEAVHCGVPIVSVPLFGDQFANSMSAVENGFGITVDIETLNTHVLQEAIKTVLQNSYQKRAKELSDVWLDRPMSPLNTAIYWIEYTARHRGKTDMKPKTVDLPFYQFLMADVILVLCLLITIVYYIIKKLIACVRNAIIVPNNSKKNKKIE